jgi:hypothetical protein
MNKNKINNFELITVYVPIQILFFFEHLLFFSLYLYVFKYVFSNKLI